MSCRCVYVEEITLQTRLVQRLGGTSGNDEILLGRQALLHYLVDVNASTTVRKGFVDASVDVVVPAENLFGPHLECVEQMQITAVSECELILAVENEPFCRSRIVVDVRVGDECVDTVHLQRNLPVDRNLAPNNRSTEFAVVLRRRRVRQFHRLPSFLLSRPPY